MVYPLGALRRLRLGARVMGEGETGVIGGTGVATGEKEDASK